MARPQLACSCREQISELEETIRRLKHTLTSRLSGGGIIYPREWLLQRKSADILTALYLSETGICSNVELAASTGITSAEPNDVLKVHICRLRAALRRFDIIIQTRWGQGYELPAKSKAAVAAAIQERIAA